MDKASEEICFLGTTSPSGDFRKQDGGRRKDGGQGHGCNDHVASALLSLTLQLYTHLFPRRRAGSYPSASWSTTATSILAMATMTKTVDRPESPSILDKLDEIVPAPLAQFDAFPKVPSTYKTRSESRGFLTIFVAIVALLLVLNDIGEYIRG